MTEHGPLYDTAALCLQVVTDAWDDAGDPAPVPLPTRQYVVPGVIAAYDCSQLVVTVVGVGYGQPGQALGVPVAQCAPLLYATYRVEVVRDVPTVGGNGRPPSADKLDAAARTTLRDLDMLHRALVNAREFLAGGGDPDRGRGIPVVVSNAVPAGSDGGLAASRVDIDIPTVRYADAPAP